MFHRHQKGEYGYLKAYRREKLIISLILAVMIALIIAGMLFLFGDTGRVMIVFAILLTLPFAKFLIAWIMCAKFEPLTEEQYRQLCAEIAGTKKGGISDGLYFDIVITQYEGMKFYQSMCIKNGKIIALVLDKDFEQNKKAYEKWIQSCIADSKYKYSVTVYGDVQEYIKRVRSISSPNDKTAMIDRHMTDRILTTCV